jgi:hypothetical protein
MRKRFKKRWFTRIDSCLHYLTDGVNRRAVSVCTYFHLWEIPYNALRALCTGVLIIFVFVSLRLIILFPLFVSFLSDCFPNFCGKASLSNFCSILSFLVKTEVCLQSVPPLPFSKQSADTTYALSVVPSVLTLLQNISKHNQLTNLNKKIRFELFSTYFCHRVGMLLWVEVHYVFSGIRRFVAEWDVQNNRHTFSGDEREESLLRPDSAVLLRCRANTFML